jgi:hypothetical protein
VRPHQNFPLNANTSIGHLRNYSGTFIKRLNLLWFLNMVFLFFFLFPFYSCITISIITILLSLFWPFSLSLLLYYKPLFSLPTTLSAPSHPLFPVFTSPFYHSPTCHHTTPPSYTLTTYWLAYCSNCTQPLLPSISDTNTLCYNRNTRKHTQGPQNPAATIPLNPPTHPFSHSPFSATFTNSPNLYLTKWALSSPQLQLFIDIIIKAFFI